MPIEQREDVLGGAPHIRGHRIGVHHIVRAFRDRDMDIPTIAEEVYPHLSESAVREAIIWALEHDEEFGAFEDRHRERLQEIEGDAVTPTEGHNA